MTAPRTAAAARPASTRPPWPGRPDRPGRVLVARLDNIGDLLISGPAIRAVAASAQVALLCGPRGRPAADLLPGVDHILQWRAPWIDPQPPPVTAGDVDALVADVRALRADAALILTSFHQSPLPLALLLRLAEVPWIGAISHDYAGSLLDLRHRLDEAAPLAEPERALHLARAAGFSLPPGDDGKLAVKPALPSTRKLTGPPRYVAIHPGASVPARRYPPGQLAHAARLLAAGGTRVVVTGSADERSLTAFVAGDTCADLGGRTGLAELASVFAGADVVVAANTGPAHLAAAVGTPVVSLFAPTVPAHRWAPYGVPTLVLGDQWAACRGSRATVCPVPGHPCLSSVSAREVADAAWSLSAGRMRVLEAQP